jgi:hypothetical protein
MRHLICLGVGLVMTWACTLGLEVDTCSTGFAITWLVMFLCAEALAWLVVSELA